MEYRILGPLEVVAAAKPSLGGPKQRGVLALLMVRAGQVITADRLVEELWHGHPPRRAQVTLRSYLSRLRTTLEQAAGRPVLLTRAPGYVLDIDPGEVDATRFERLVRDGQAALAADRTDHAVDLLRAAERLWRGPVLEDLADLEAVRAERRRLEELRLAALESRIEADLAAGRHAELIGELEALLTEHPLREELHGKRMLALYRSGRQAESLATFESARRMLAEDLGIEPGIALRRLHQAVLRQEPDLEWVAAPQPAMAPVAQAATHPGPYVEPVPGEPVPGGQAGPFVGRAEELVQLKTAMTEALAGRGRVVLLVGEPGIGKTRTAQELTAEARAAGFDVLCGRAWEDEGAPAFWPWVKALRTWLERLDAPALCTVCGPEAPVIAQLIPVVAERIPGLAVQPRLEPAQARFRLFDAVTRLLRRAAAIRPVLLVLDDLHRADVPSLRLLQFLTREIADARLLVVCTYRDLDDYPGQAFRDVIADVWREPSTLHFRLTGLQEPEIARYVELVSRGHIAESLVGELCVRTGGNPFFLREIVRLLLDEGGVERVNELGERMPHGVRAAVERRLDALSEQARTSLSLASVAGREFSLETLEVAGDASAEPLLAHLEQATAAGLVTEITESPGGYRFAHVLIRDALYTSLSGVRRARLHLRVGEAMERIHGRDLDLHLAELAHHFRQASDPVARRKAMSYAARAGERALALYAYEEGARQFQLALDDNDEPDQQCELLLRLADAQVRAGDMAAGEQTCHRAAGLARDHDRPWQLAEAAVLLHDDPLEFGAFEPELVGLLDEALTGLGEDEPALRAKVLARLAMALSWAPAGDGVECRELERRCQDLSDQAVALARDAGDDPAVLAYALGARNYVHAGPEHAYERLKVSDEMLRLADSCGSSGDRVWELQARRWRVITFAELSLFEEFDAEVEAYAKTADELRMPNYLAWVPLWRGLRAVMAGDLEAAGRLGAEARAAASDPPAPAVLQGYGAAQWTLCREQGRLGDLEPILADFVERFPEQSGWRATLALTLTAAGRTEEAGRELVRLARDGFADVPRGCGWFLTMTRLAETCVLLNDADRAVVLYDLLLPYDHCCAVAFGVASTGPVALHLGRLAETLGRWPAARRHYEAAVEISRRLDAESWLVQALGHLSRARSAGRT